MSISFTNMLHGATMLMLLEEISNINQDCNYHLKSNSSKSSYILNLCINKHTELKIGLYLKLSRRGSPWGFTFKDTHQNEINDLAYKCDTIFLLLITGQEGIAVIDEGIFPQLLDEKIEKSEWISVSRKPRQNFRVTSKDGTEKMIIPKNSFPNKITEYIENNVSIPQTKISRLKVLKEKINLFKKILNN